MTPDQKQLVLKELGVLRYLFLYLLGRPLGGAEYILQLLYPDNSNFRFYFPIQLWEIKVCHQFVIYVENAPNIIHRAFQRLFLGFQWRCLLKEESK